MRSERLDRLMTSRVTLKAAVLIVLLGAGLAMPALAHLQEDSTAPSLEGIYTVSIAEEDVPPDLRNGPALVGQWNLTFGADGTYNLARQDVGEVARGTFESGPATLSFREWDGIVGCEISAQDGAGASYAWRETDDRLALTAINDLCVERLTLLTSHPLGSIEACAVEPAAVSDPFSLVEGTPSAAPPVATGVAAQEGFGSGADVEATIDDLLRSANGCWATADPDRFMGLHSEGLRQQIAFMGPPDAFTSELREFMASPLTLKRIGEVTLDDPDHAWAYVEVNLGGEPNPQRVNFVQEQGAWRFDTLFLFGPPIPGAPPEIMP